MSQSNLSETIRRLKQYIEQKDLDDFNDFLDKNEISPKNLNSILCFALQNYRSNYEMIDYISLLIAKGADQNSFFHNKSSNQQTRIDEKDNVTLLMYACMHADIRLVDLISTDKNIKMRDKNGKNALFYVLISDKGDNPDVIGSLIYHGIDVNCIGKIETEDKNFENHTPLSLSASKNMIDSFKILIENNADPNYKVNTTGDTVLHIAVKKNNVEMVKLLLNTNKIKFEEKNKENKTALELAHEISKKINNEEIYKLIKDKIEEGNREGDIVAQELLSEDQKNFVKKHNNDIKNININNVGGKKEENNNLNSNANKNNQNKNMNKNINVKKIYNFNDLSFEKNFEKKLKIFDKYINKKNNSNSNNNIQIHVNFPKNANFNTFNNFSNIFTLENINNENIPILTIDLLSKEFLDYKNSFIINNKEKNKFKILEEENAFLKNELDLVKEKNNNLIKSNNEKDNRIKEIENKYKISINELNKKISFLEKQHENDINALNELKKGINKNNNKNCADNHIIPPSENINNNKNNVINNNKEITIQYLNKKFINFEYDLIFYKNKNNYVRNCLSKDLTEFELFVKEHIKKSSNLNEELLNNVQKAVNECFQDYEVHLYGSHATNLCLPWSDLDVVLISKNNNNNQLSLDSKHLLLSKLNDYLKHQPWIKEVNYISSANIPIVKIISIEKYNNKPIDISIQDEKHFGLKCVDLVKKYMNKYECLKPLVLALKNILKQANLNDPYKGGMSSYGLILMIVSFLQQKENSGIDISLNDNNIGQLFFDFIHYYGTEFQFNKSIIYIKNNINTINDIDELKYQNIQHTSGLIIIDPLNINNNVAKSCYHFLGVKMAFIISLSAISEDCECGCHYCDNNEEYSTLHVEHCFLKRIFHAVKRLV